MDPLDYIKTEIEKLYKSNPDIHISVRSTRPKIAVEGAPATITGIYRNIFQIEETGSGSPRSHTFRYGDVLIGHVVIEELSYFPTDPTAKQK